MHSSHFLSSPASVQCGGNEILPSDFRLKGGSSIYRVKYQQRFYVEPVLIFHCQQRFLYEQRFNQGTVVDGLSTAVLHRTTADSVL
jgi:hypothetical protein